MTTQERRIQLKNRKFYGAIIVIGIILFLCNMFKLVPGMENPIATFITILIAYGFILGLGLIGFGVYGFVYDK